MDPMSLLDHAHKLGLTVVLDGEQLRITGPKTPAAAALVQQMAPYKTAVIELLSPSPLAPTRPSDDLVFTLNPIEALPIAPEQMQPMWYKTNKPPLPVDLWRSGLSLAEALAAQARLKTDYFCTCGKGANGYYVRCDPRHYRLVTA